MALFVIWSHWSHLVTFGHIWSQVVTLITVEVEDHNNNDLDGDYGSMEVFGFTIWRQAELVKNLPPKWFGF